MMVGAKILLNVELDAARDGLATLAGGSWMLSLPQQDSRAGHPSGHPAGRARPGFPVAVTFGKLTATAGSCTLLTVRWESVEPGDRFTVLLDADITLAPDARQPGSMLTLAGVCRLPPGTLSADGYDLARVQVIEAVREFITSVADVITRSATHGREHQPRGQAWSWLTGHPRTP